MSISRKATLAGNGGDRNNLLEVLHSNADASVFFHYIESFAHIYCLGTVFLTAVVLPAICTCGRSLCGTLARQPGRCSWTPLCSCAWALLCTTAPPTSHHHQCCVHHRPGVGWLSAWLWATLTQLSQSLPWEESKSHVLCMPQH